jgi:hypothetical protein
VQELAEVVVASVRMVEVEPSHCCSATGIGPVLRLLGLVNDLWFACLLLALTVGAHYTEHGSTPQIRVWEMNFVLLTKSVEIKSNTVHQACIHMNGDEEE